MSVQDDAREKNMIRLFNLKQEKGRSRSDTDAYLEIGGEKILFELKSTTSKSVSTVRDLGPDHFKKWENIHWIICAFDKSNTEDPSYCIYISPKNMLRWTDKKWNYVKRDFMLAELASQRLQKEDLYAIAEKKSKYTLEDAKSIQKMQYSKKQYEERMDLGDGYSPEAMLKILSERCEYLIERGSTLNNPHISLSDFSDLTMIDDDHAATLRRLIETELEEEHPAAQDI